MRAKFILDLSEAQWELYPAQSPYDAEGKPIPDNEGKEHAEWIVDLPDGPWVQFTYGMLRDNNGGEIFGDLQYDREADFFRHDGRVFSDLVIEFLPDEDIVYVVAWTGGYEDPAIPDAGRSFLDKSPDACVITLLRLRDSGLHVPQKAIDRLLSEGP